MKCPNCNKSYNGNGRVMCYDCGIAFVNIPHIARIVEAANRARKLGGTFYLKFTCLHCGSRQTIEEPNSFYPSGRCEECNGVSDFKSPAINLGLLFEAGTAMDVINAVIGEKE
jgi:hypothetical protein